MEALQLIQFNIIIRYIFLLDNMLYIEYTYADYYDFLSQFTVII